MERLDEILQGLPERHRTALSWFQDNAGSIRSWPTPLADRTILASKAKGIYKPSWTKYALSVRQNLGGPYPDREPIAHPDGTWTLLYFQEGTDPGDRDRRYTNRGMLECHRDHVPVGVVRQVAGVSWGKYEILGVALVSGWEEGYFFLEGFSPGGTSAGQGPRAQIDAIRANQALSQQPSDSFDPADLTDGRARSVSSTVLRQGQAEFRQKLMDAYQGTCTVSGCKVEEVLEASHIVPYLGPRTNHVSNGMLLRADLHILFDLGLIAIDGTTMTVLVSDRLNGTCYESLRGKQVALPLDASARPDPRALGYHRQWVGFQLGDTTPSACPERTRSPIACASRS